MTRRARAETDPSGAPPPNQAPAGHLDLLLLACLQRTGPVHGYTPITALRESSADTLDLHEGTAHPALHRRA